MVDRKPRRLPIPSSSTAQASEAGRLAASSSFPLEHYGVSPIVLV